MTKDQLEIAAWNPLILDRKQFDKPPKFQSPDPRSEVLALYQRARVNFPKHDLTFRYGWAEADTDDLVEGIIGMPEEPEFISMLKHFLAMDRTPKNKEYKTRRDTDKDYLDTLNYWWPKCRGVPMMPVAFFRMPATYAAIQQLTARQLDQYSWFSGYGCDQLRERMQHSFSADRLSSSEFAFMVWSAGDIDFSSWEPNCRVVSAKYWPKDPLDSGEIKPEEWWKTEEESDRRSAFILKYIREQTDFKSCGEHSVQPPQARLRAPRLMVEADCRRGFKCPKKADYDYNRCGRLGYNKFDKAPDFTLAHEVCSMFGAPASQQEPRRPMNPHNFGYGSAMIPFLSFSDQQADMTYQFYADPLRMDYCCGYRPYGWVDASCT